MCVVVLLCCCAQYRWSRVHPSKWPLKETSGKVQIFSHGINLPCLWLGQRRAASECGRWCSAQAFTVIGNEPVLEQARFVAAMHLPDLVVAKGRYPFELDNSLRPLKDRISF